MDYSEKKIVAHDTVTSEISPPDPVRFVIVRSRIVQSSIYIASTITPTNIVFFWISATIFKRYERSRITGDIFRQC